VGAVWRVADGELKSVTASAASLRGAQRRSNPTPPHAERMDWFASLAMTRLLSRS
jgi:hypothetical protein